MGDWAILPHLLGELLLNHERLVGRLQQRNYIQPKDEKEANKIGTNRNRKIAEIKRKKAKKFTIFDPLGWALGVGGWGWGRRRNPRGGANPRRDSGEDDTFYMDIRPGWVQPLVEPTRDEESV